MPIRCYLETISELQKKGTRQDLHCRRTWQMVAPDDTTQMVTYIKIIDNIIDVKLQEYTAIDWNFATHSVSICSHYSWHLSCGYFFKCVKNKLFTLGCKYFASCFFLSPSSLSPETLFSLTDHIGIPLNWHICHSLGLLSHIQDLVYRLAKLPHHSHWNCAPKFPTAAMHPKPC